MVLTSVSCVLLVRMEASCLELALEGERLCKLGDYGGGVSFFEAAIQVGTEDLQVLSAVYSQLGNAYFHLHDYTKALEFHHHDLTLTRSGTCPPCPCRVWWGSACILIVLTIILYLNSSSPCPCFGPSRVLPLSGVFPCKITTELDFAKPRISLAYSLNIQKTSHHMKRKKILKCNKSVDERRISNKEYISVKCWDVQMNGIAENKLFCVFLSGPLGMSLGKPKPVGTLGTLWRRWAALMKPLFVVKGTWISPRSLMIRWGIPAQFTNCLPMNGDS